MGPWCPGARQMLKPVVGFYQKLNVDLEPRFHFSAKMVCIYGSFLLHGLIAIIHDYWCRILCGAFLVWHSCIMKIKTLTYLIVDVTNLSKICSLKPWQPYSPEVRIPFLYPQSSTYTSACLPLILLRLSVANIW